MYNSQSWDQIISLKSQSPDTDALVSAGTYGAGALPLDGVLASGGNYTAAIPSFLTITCADDESANSFSFHGLDASGNINYQFTVAGVDTGTVLVEVPFYQLLSGSIIMAEDATGNVSIGVSSQTATNWIPMDVNRTNFNVGISVFVEAGATLTYTIEYTDQTILLGVPPTLITEDLTLVDQTASGTTPEPISTSYVRMRYSAWTDGSATLTVKQSGSYASFKAY